MKDLLQYVLDGLSIGSVYALIALGLVVVYRGTGHVNFAQGEMALFSTLVTWWLHDKGLPLLLAIAVSAALSFVGGAVIEVGLMRPASKRSAFAPVVVAIGLFQGLNSLSGLLFPKSGQGLPFPSLFPNEPGDFVSIFGASWRIERIGVLAVVLALLALLAGVQLLVLATPGARRGERLVAVALLVAALLATSRVPPPTSWQASLERAVIHDVYAGGPKGALEGLRQRADTPARRATVETWIIRRDAPR